MFARREPSELAALPRRGRKLGLRAALTALVVGTVALTAVLIHASWSYTARENVADVVGQLNRQIVDSTHHELRGVLGDAWSMQEAVRSIFFQGTISTSDEAKREFVFLSLLRSQPSLSWISLGFPDGAFFGARKASDTEIDMIEVARDPEGGAWRQRTDYYTPEEGDIFFNNREFSASAYDSRAQDWYKRAVEENGPGWQLVSDFPGSNRQAISTSTPLVVNGDFAGVINIVIDLSRLSRFLETLQVGKTGTVVVLDRNGGVVASADADAVELQENGELPALHLLGAKSALLRVAGEYLASGDADLTTLSATTQTQFRASDGRLYFVTLSPLKFESWSVATVIPAEDFLASIDRNARMLLAALAALTLLMAGIALLAVNRTIAGPLLRIVGELKHIESFELEGITRQHSPLRELDNLSGALIQMSRGLASFQKYMPTALVRTLVSRGVEARPGGREEILTVLFTDIAGFTGLSERLGDGIVPVLGEYLELATASVHGHNGTIYKFIGDAVMAFWGAPVPSESHALDACAAALDLQRRLAAQRAEAEREGRTPLSIRIGINTGRMLVGNIGSRERLSYTVIGDSVNVASRLEAVNKRYGTEILVGEDTRRSAGDAIVVRRLDWVAVYGRMQGIAIYELLGLTESGVAPPAWVAAFEAGLEAYAARRWEEALKRFRTVIGMRGRDRPSEIFIERCRSNLASPPHESWTPVAVLEAK